MGVGIRRTSPLVAAVGFAIIAIVVVVHNEFRAGLIVGIAGVVIHVFELVSHGLRGLAVIEGVMFATNLGLSILIAAFSWSLRRDSSPQDAKRR